MNVTYIYILLMLSVVSLYSADKDMQLSSHAKTYPHVITREGIAAVHTDIYNKLLSISRTLQDQVNDLNKQVPLPNEPYYPVNRNIESLQYIVNFISAQNADIYLSTLSLIELVHLYQEADFWAVDANILDTIRHSIIAQLRNKNTLTWLFSNKENLFHFINACNPVTLDTLTQALHPYTSNLLWHTVTQAVRISTDHTDWVKTAAIHTDGTLFSCSDDHTIRVWKPDAQGTYHCIQTLTGHTNSISSVAVHTDGMLFSGSYDQTIRVWKKDAQGAYECVQILTGHNNFVYSVAVHTSGILFSGSSDNTIRIWKTNPQYLYHCEQILAGNKVWLVGTTVHTNGILFSGLSDKTIHVWKILEEHLSLEQYLLLHWLYITYQLNGSTQLDTLPAHQFQIYRTLPQSIKDRIVTWYKPGYIQFLFFKPYLLASAGLVAGCATLGTYLYYK